MCAPPATRGECPLWSRCVSSHHSTCLPSCLHTQGACHAQHGPGGVHNVTRASFQHQKQHTAVVIPGECLAVMAKLKALCDCCPSHVTFDDLIVSSSVSLVQYLSATCHELCRHFLGIDLGLEVVFVILHPSNVSPQVRVQANGSGRPPSSTPLPPTASKRNPFDDSSNARRLPQSGAGAASTSSRASSESGRGLTSARSSSSLGHWQQ